jgi:hypothetical protein
MAHERLTHAEVQLVLRRAAELERRGSDDEALSARELNELAAEVGLSPAAVQQALGEMRAGALETPSPPGALERVLGPRRIVVERTVTGDVATVQARLERLLREQLLRKKRDFGARALWEPEPGWLARLKRKLDWSGTQRLGDAHELEVTVVDAGGGRTTVHCATDVGALQRRVVTGASLGTAVGLGAALVLSAMGTPHVIEWLAAAGAAAGGSIASLRVYRRELGATETALEHLLDQLERGRPPTPSALHLLFS